MKFDTLTARLLKNGWSLVGDDETGLNFVNLGTEVEVRTDLETGITYLSIGNGMREKELKDLDSLSFKDNYTTFVFSDGEEWDFEANEEDFDYYYEDLDIVNEEREKLRSIKKERKANAS